MKRKLLAIALATALFTPTAMAETMSFNGTTYNVTRTEKQLAQGVKYTHLIIDRGSSSYSGGSSVHIVEADLTDPTVSVKHGDSGRDSRRSLATQAANLSSSTATVVAGANANFWCTTEAPYSTKLKYEPFGVSIKDGHMYSDPNCKTLAHVGGPTTTGMLAIDENGKCYIDYLKAQVGDQGVGSGWNFTITNNNPSHAHTFGLDQVNGVVCPGTAAMYSSIYGSSKAFRPVTSMTDYSTATGTCTEILMDFASGTSAWNIGGETKLVIKEIRQNAGSGTLGSHDCAIVCRDSYASVANGWAVGDEMTITARVNFQSVGSPNRIMQATSGNCITMANGVIGYNSSQEGYNSTNYARTLYGTNDDGSKLWIAVCEHYPNKQYTYLGFTTKAMTEILKIFGATWATQVDCGGSAQMYAGGSQVSTSTDSGGLRNVQSGVFILSSAGAAAPDTEKPTIARTTTVQNGTDSFYAYAYATDNVGVTSVKFPTWTENNGQDDLVWYEGAKGNWTVDGQTYNYRYLVNKSEHKNENGPYTIHVYAYDAAGNNSAVGMSFTFETVQPSASLKASKTEITLSAEQGATAPYTDVTITGENLTSAINVACSNSSVTATKLDGWDDLTGGTLRITLNTAKETGNYTGYVAAQSGTNRVEIDFTATITAPTVTPEPDEEINVTGLTEQWIYSTNKGNLSEISYFAVASPVTRDMCFADGKLYVLNATTNAASVAIVDAYTGKPTGSSLSLNGISGGTYMLSGIKSLGNTVIGSNFCGAAGTLKVYKWSSDTAEPELWFSTSDHGNVDVGRSMNTYGDMNNGVIAFGGIVAKTETTAAYNAVVYYTVTNGVVNTTPVVVNCSNGGGNASNQSVSVLPDGSFWFNNKDTQPLHIDANGTTSTTLSSSIAGKQYGAAIKAFTYAKRNYVAFTSTLGSSASSAWGNGTMRLVNVTDEANPVLIGNTCYPADGLGTASWGSAGTNAVDYEITSDKILNLWVMVPYQGIAMYQFKPTPSGVENLIATPEATAPVEWYNLQGVRVSGDNLTPGIYIRRQGNEVKKVIVK